MSLFLFTIHLIFKYIGKKRECYSLSVTLLLLFCRTFFEKSDKVGSDGRQSDIIEKWNTVIKSVTKSVLSEN